MWGGAWLLAGFGLVVIFTDWIDWPWWVGFGLGSPLAVALLIFFDDATGGELFGDDWAADEGFGGGVGGDFGGGGDGGG